MIRFLLLLALAAVAALGVVVGKERLYEHGSGTALGRAMAARPEPTLEGEPLYRAGAATVTATTRALASPMASPLVLPDCRLTVCDKQDVPSQREGVLLVVGTELQPGEQLAPENLIQVRIGSEPKTFRRLREGDPVKAGQLLAYLDDQLARDDYAIKQARVVAAKADLEAAIKSSDEAKNKFDVQLWLRREGRGAASEEEVRNAKLNWEKSVYEAVGKREAVTLAERELSQAETFLRMHQIRSIAAGVVKIIYKHRGEAVKALEPVVQVHGFTRLRVEGQVDVEQLGRLRLGMPALVEPSRREGPREKFIGHFQDVRAVAVSRDSRRIVSAGEDGSVRVWDVLGRREIRSVVHPTPVRAVRCTPPSTPRSLCLTGAADGKPRIFPLDEPGELRELFGRHDGAITSVAWSPDGRVCATGGEDGDICLWDVASGAVRYRLASAHAGTVTALHFTPQARLVSAGRDNALRIWALGEQAATLATAFEHRSGEVAQLGVSADGRFALYDEPGTLRVLSLPEGRTEGLLQQPGGTTFSTVACFGSSGKHILTAGDGLLRVWQTPQAGGRPRELRQLLLPDGAAVTCAAFAPDGSFIAAGTRDRQVLVWPAPPDAEIEPPLTATVTFLDHAEEAASRQIRVWAELANPHGLLLPGTSATLVLH